MIGGVKTPMMAAASKNQKKRLKVNYWKNKGAESKALVLESDIASIYNQRSRYAETRTLSLKNMRSLKSKEVFTKKYSLVQDHESYILYAIA